MSFVVKSLTATGMLLLSVANTYAADIPTKAARVVQPSPILGWVSPILATNNQISLDVIGQNMDYLEYGNGRQTQLGPLDSERGWQPGLQLTGSVMRDLGPITNVYLMGQFTWAKGNNNYVGGGYIPGTPVTFPYGYFHNTSGAETRDFELRLGKGFDVGQDWMFTPYFGVGYRVWDRYAVDNHETYEHGYTGGGLLIQWAPTNQWVISANGLVGSTFDPQMTASNANYFTFTLGSKLMWKAGLSTDYALTPQWHLNAGFDYTHFNYGISNTSPNNLLEPDSRSGIWTVKAGVGYSFYQPSARY